MSAKSYKVELKPDGAMAESRSALSAILLLGADPVPQEAGLLFPKYMSEGKSSICETGSGCCT
jgi:hypothetical protein